MTTPNEQPGSDPTMGRRILLADDEPHITMVLARKLRGAGFQVETSTNGEEALLAATRLTPDLLITDLQMPRMSGIELATAMSAGETTSAVPIIMLTARGYVLAPDALNATNIKFVMSKPFSAKEILAMVIEVLGGESSSGRVSA